MDDLLDFDEAAIYLSQKTGNRFTSEKIYRLASEWKIQSSVKLIGAHHAGFIDDRGHLFSQKSTLVEGIFHLKNNPANTQLITIFFRKIINELFYILSFTVQSHFDSELFFNITGWKFPLDIAAQNFMRHLNDEKPVSRLIISDSSHIGFSECDLDSYMGATAAAPAEPITTLQAKEHTQQPREKVTTPPKKTDPRELASCHKLISTLLDMAGIDTSQPYKAAGFIDTHTRTKGFPTLSETKIVDLIESAISIRNKD